MNNPAAHAAFEERTCRHCKKQFWYRSAAGYGRNASGVFCSKECHYNAGRITLKCATCRKSFDAWRCMKGKRKYCGRVCAGTATPPNQPRPHDGRFDAAWYALRDLILERDNHECQHCGTTAALVIHHIVEWKDSRDNSPSNLITLCRSCHSKVHLANLEQSLTQRRIMNAH